MKCKSCEKEIDEVLVISVHTRLAPVDENKAVDLEASLDVDKTRGIACRNCLYNLEEVIQG